MAALIDDVLPVYDHNEIHRITISQPGSRIYPLLSTLDMNPSKLIKTLFLLRGMPARDIRLDRMINAGPFAVLDADPDRELLLGLLTDHIVTPVPIEEKTCSAKAFFNGWQPDQGLKIAWNFSLDTGDRPGTTLVTTETRIKCLGRRAKTFFRAYWTVIRPFSGLVRMEMLKLLKADAESLPEEASG